MSGGIKTKLGWNLYKLTTKKTQFSLCDQPTDRTLLDIHSKSKIYSKRWLFPVFSFFFYNQIFYNRFQSFHKSKALYTHRIHYKHRCLLYITVKMRQYNESAESQTPHSKTCYSHRRYSNGNTRWYEDIMVNNTVYVVLSSGVSQQQYKKKEKLHV